MSSSKPQTDAYLTAQAEILMLVERRRRTGEVDPDGHLRATLALLELEKAHHTQIASLNARLAVLEAAHGR
jgi:hypothetical protein